MKWFRRTLCESRIFILVFLVVELFYLVDGRNYVYAHQVYEQKEARLKEMSELLGIPVEKLRPDHESLFDSLRTLFIGEQDPVKEAGLKRLREVLKKHEEVLAANPYLPQIEGVKREHAVYRIEGVLNDLMQLTEPRGGKALPEASQRALLRNLHYALQDDLALPAPEGLPAKAQAKLASFQAKLDRMFEAVRPIVAETQSRDMTGTLAQKVGELKLIPSVEMKRSSRAPRFTDRPLPLRRVEKKARLQEVGAEVDTKAGSPTPAISEAPSPGIPSKAGIAPEIVKLAESLGNSPARIFSWVHDKVDFDPKFGAVKGPLATLLERSGTPWDQAWLLHDLLVAAGVDARFEWGEVEITPEILTNITGLDDPIRAGDLLTTAGVPVVLFVQGSRVVVARMPHVWVKAFIDYVPNRGATAGPGDTWVRMDPSIKRFDYAPGIRIHDQVPFSFGGYLQSATRLSPRRFYEDALWSYIRATNIECTTLEQLKPAASIVAESFPFVPGTLRAKITQVDGETAAEPPLEFQQDLSIEVRRAEGLSLVSWTVPWPSVYGKRVEVAWAGATPDDQATLDANGGVFGTPPYLVDLRPSVRVDGAEIASSGSIGSAQDVEIFVTTAPVVGSPTAVSHQTLAGERHVLALDFGRIPQEVIDRHRETLAAAIVAGDAETEEAETLYLLGARYMRDLSRDLDDLAGWKWHRIIKLGTEAMTAQGGKVTTAVDGSPISFTKAQRTIDVATMPLGIFPSDGVPGLTKETFELLGAQGSLLEGQVFEQVLQRAGIAAVSALTLAQREGQVLTLVDAGNVDAVLASVNLGEDVESDVRSAVGQGKVAWVPQSPVTLNQWTGVGYILEDPASGAAGFLISGGLAGGSEAGFLGLLEDALGSEAWLEATGLGALVRLILDLARGIGVPDGDGGGPGTNQGDPVNMSTGNFWLTLTDLALQARGLAIRWTRTYNSRSTRVGPLGYGWSFTYGESLEERADGSVVYHEHDGTAHVFVADGAGGYERPPGKHLALTKTPTQFELRGKEGLVTTFALDGRMLSISDPNGNTVSLVYGVGGNLESVVDAAGRTALTVTTAGGKITRVEDLSGRAVEYIYAGDDLVSVVDVADETWTYSYDGGHNLISRTNPLGNTDSYAYDALDRCVSHVDPLGAGDSFSYSGAGRGAVLTDRRGFERFFEFDDRGRAVLEVDPLGNAAASTWDEDNNRESSSDARGGVTTRTFDANGNLLTETDPLNATKSFTYEPAFSRMLTMTDAQGQTNSFTYDAQGNLLERSQVVDGDTITETYAYDAFGQVVSQVDGNGVSTTLVWDDTKGVVESRTDSLGQTMTVASDSLGRLSGFTDEAGNVTSVALDVRDGVTAITDPYGQTTSILYDPLGRPISETNAAGTKTTAYDAAGRVVRQTDPLGHEVRTEYDPTGNAIARIDGRGNRWQRTYDALGRPLAMIDPLGNTWTNGFCAEVGAGCGVGCTGGTEASFCERFDPEGNSVRREHDALGRVASIADALGNTTEILYDEVGRRSGIRNALGHLTSFEYDAKNRLTAVVQANGARTEYGYDLNGKLIEILDAEGRSWSRTYDARGRLATLSDPLGNTETFSYDALGNLAERLTPNGDAIELTYDVRRLTRIDTPGQAPDTLTYDTLGRLISMAGSDASYTYTYDAVGRPTSVTDQLLGRTVAYVYDENGNLIQLDGPRGTVRYAYDAANRLVQISDPVAGTFLIEYDLIGRRSRLRYPNGVETTYSYDAAGRIEAVLTRTQAGTIVDGYSYTYDAVGNRLSVQHLHGSPTDTYSYDELNRLTRWERGSDRFEQYSYDRVGNRLSLSDEAGSVTYSYDLANRLSEEVRTFSGGGSQATTYTWSGNGNLLSRATVADTTTYTWDPRDRLRAVNGPSGDFSYGYDSFGIRVRETRDGVGRRFLYANEDLLAEYDSAGGELAYYTHGPGIDEALAQQVSAAAGPAFLHRDALGSVTALTDLSGATAGTRQYAAFGAVEAASGLASRFGYTGRELEPTGLMYYRARYYDAASGRFLSEDPVDRTGADAAGFGKYRYAANNPATVSDPMGLIDWICDPFQSFGISPSALIPPFLSVAWGLLLWECRSREPTTPPYWWGLVTPYHASVTAFTIYHGVSWGRLPISYTFGSIPARDPRDEPNPWSFYGPTFYIYIGFAIGIGVGWSYTNFNLADPDSAIALPNEFGDLVQYGFDWGGAVAGVGYTIGL